MKKQVNSTVELQYSLRRYARGGINNALYRETYYSLTGDYEWKTPGIDSHSLDKSHECTNGYEYLIGRHSENY